jgi:two-component system LytT family response regulator
MKITALVADSEPGVRDQIVWLLNQKSDIQVIGVAASAVDAIDAIERLEPDVVFLDPEMPDGDGFDVIHTIGVARMPYTIVVTANPDDALRAFEVHAVDCVLKPFDPGRLHKAVAAARQRVEHDRAGAIVSRLMALGHEPAPVRPADRLAVRDRGRVHFIDIDQIDWVEAQGNYSRLHVSSSASARSQSQASFGETSPERPEGREGGRSYLTRETLTNLLARLGVHRFFRIHRSCIVRIEMIKELQLAAGGDYDVVLKNGLKLSLSRQQRDALQERLAKGA